MDRYERAIELAMSKGVRRQEADPLFYRLIRRLGMQIRPPLYESFGRLFVLQSLMFGVLFAAMMLIVQRDAQVWMTLLASGVGSLAFGGIMASLIRRKARRLDLPAWEAI